MKPDRRSPKKSVTWSPVVKCVSRDRGQSNTKHTMSVFVLRIPGLNKDKQIVGKVTAHSRRNTRSVLLTIRNNIHRDLQFLLDLSQQRVRRIYDGCKAWDVCASSTSHFDLDAKLGSILWMDDGVIRLPNTSGFRLEWMAGNSTFAVMPAKTSKTSKQSAIRYREAKRTTKKTTRKKTIRRTRAKHKSRRSGRPKSWRDKHRR